MMNINKWCRYLWLPLLMMSIYLLFFVERDTYSSRSWQAIWDLGHIIVFIFFIYLLYRFVPAVARLSVVKQLILVTILVVVTGGGIELIQGGLNRSSELDDLFLDLVGAMLAVTMLAPQFGVLSRPRKTALYGVMSVVVVICSWPLISSLLDEYQARAEFPVLSSLEHPFELSRWVSQQDISVQREIKKTGCCALRLSMRSGDYGSAKLQYFPANWATYNRLVIDIFNRQQQVMVVGVSVYDDSLGNNQYVWPGLFMRRYNVQPGWNSLELDYGDELQKIVSKQPHRGAMRGLIIFVEHPFDGQTIYIDNVQLIE